MFKLPRLPVNWLKQPGLFERYWDEAMKKIEDILNEILALPEIQAAIDAANAAADAANTAANNAQTSTNAQAAESSLVTSYVSGFTPPLISINSSGTVTIANHQRVYGNSTLNPTVSVVGGTFATTGVPTDTIRVYYNDPTRAGGAVTYLYTIDPTAPPVQGNNVHSVGAVVVPSSGSGDGRPVQPPGYVEV